MSRYIDVETVTFTDINGNSFPVKDVRPISTEETAFTLDVTSNNLLDEIAARRDVYGDEGEQQSFRLFDKNIEALTEVDFDLSQIRKLEIPL